MKAVLIDDEVDSIQVLKNLLHKHCPGVDIVGEASTVTSALQVIERSMPDLLLLDIAINDETAFDLLDRLPAVNFHVIFITAWDHHAVRAFRYSAIDYLLKPVDGDDLRKAIDKVLPIADNKQILGQLKVLENNISTFQFSRQKIAIPTLTGLSFILLNDILRLEAHINCTNIYLSNSTRIVTTRSISEWEGFLPDTIFYRIHNSHIINLNKVQKYRKGRGGSLVMEDGSEIEVAFRRRDDFLRRLLK
jgi:two-component system, LytTR family, response regulator